MDTLDQPLNLQKSCMTSAQICATLNEYHLLTKQYGESIMDPIQKEIFDRLIDNASKIGQIEARQTNVESRMTTMESALTSALEELKKSYQNIDEKIDDIKLTQEGLKGQISGGWKALTFLGGAAVFLGGLFSWLYDRWESIKAAVF